MAATGEFLRLPVETIVRTYTLNVVSNDTSIKIATLGKEAGLIGSLAKQTNLNTEGRIKISSPLILSPSCCIFRKNSVTLHREGGIAFQGCSL